MTDWEGPKAFRYKLMRTLMKFDKTSSSLNKQISTRKNKRRNSIILGDATLIYLQKFKPINFRQGKQDSRQSSADFGSLPRFQKTARKADQRGRYDKKGRRVLKTEPAWDSVEEISRIRLHNQYVVAQEQKKRLLEMIGLGKLISTVRKEVLQGRTQRVVP